MIEIGHSFFLFREAQSDALQPALEVSENSLSGMEAMRTLSPSFARELARLEQLAATDISIVLVGESGTGKELLSRAIHRMSGRSGPFVGVNCAALPTSLVQSELFGHKRGSFSGAIEDRCGLIRSADSGTLLLDELGDLNADGQGALLRVLQEGEVLPEGSSRPTEVDVRVVSASHHPLETLAAQGTFRSDLLARLSGFVFRVPPLRERREDLGLLFRCLLRNCRRDPAGVSLTQDAARSLLAYVWPLNIRELETCLASRWHRLATRTSKASTSRPRCGARR